MRIEELRLKPYANVAALGALGVCGGVFALFLFMVFFTRPVTSGGMDQTQSLLAWIAMAVPFSLIIAAHLVYARVLMKYAKD